MSFSPALDDPISRVRFGVGDIAAPELFTDATYAALLVAASGDEGAATKSAAAALAAWAATQPDRIASDGSSLSWTGRIEQWNKIALGQVSPASAPRATEANVGSGSTETQAGW